MCPGPVVAKDLNAVHKGADTQGRNGENEEEHVLTAGLFPPEDTTPERPASVAKPQEDATCDSGSCEGSCVDAEAAGATTFDIEETLFVFDWDDTLLPSSWLHRQGLRLDESSEVSQWHREQLAEVANSAVEIIRNAKHCGTVVLVTNAERGWIELSCQKFLPTLLPLLENVKAVSARTTYETRSVSSPLEWKLRAFETEISRHYGSEMLHSSDVRKNVLSLGDSVHEREALLQATARLPNCCSKSLKFTEKPDILQICKQHSLVNSCFDRIVNHNGALDLCIKCT